jgi:hypothetical protein
MNLPLIGTLDERFLMHRLRSTSIAGLTAVALTGGLFIYDAAVDSVLRWDLFAIVATAAVVKVACMTWYRFKD